MCGERIMPFQKGNKNPKSKGYNKSKSENKSRALLFSAAILSWIFVLLLVVAGYRVGFSEVLDNVLITSLGVLTAVLLLNVIGAILIKTRESQAN